MRRRSMRSYTVAVLLTLGAIALLVPAQLAAQAGGGPGQGPGKGMRCPLYDTATEVTVTGTVDEIRQLTGKQTQEAGGTKWGVCPMAWAGTHLSLTTDQGALIVHVGPAAYLADKNFTIAKGDELKVTGSKVQYQGAEFLIAREVSKGDQVLTLRDAHGFPLWSGGRMGTSMPSPPPEE